MVTQSPSVSVPITKQVWIWKHHRIQYAVQGQGQPLVLIHGFGASIGHWQKNIPDLANGGYRVFALDLLGFGGSDKAAIAYSVDLWVELLRDFWQEHIQQPTVWIGNSIGALIALTIASRHPEISKGVVLINSAGGLSHRPHELNPVLRLVMGSFNRLVSNPVTGQFVFNNIRRKSQIRRTLYQVYRRREAVTDELVEMLYAPSCDPGAQQVFAAILTAPPGDSPEELLPTVDLPILVLWGANDPWTPITGAKIYEQARSQGKDIHIVPIEDAGHCPHDEVPEIVNPAIINWLQEKFTV